ncbi:retrovirus-related Pol polyprotein from transposon 412 isoform X1 [Brachyhypopomus gauderio]|uniref:retrovirus-related Pol polyprotein from transposon 412 isoform X1 n=1 Tax=Brachyhypopomus gauderio TaxID=698409 RepID=UPI0040426BE8
MKLRRDADGRSVAKTKTTERLQADRQEERRAYWPETWSGATCTDDAQPMTAMGAAEEWRHNAGQNSVRAERATPACSEIAACASGRNKLITPLQLPRYDGLSDWAEYDAQLKITANRMGWSDYETAAHLCLSLQGHAKRTLIELREEEHDDLTALRNALRARFGRQPLSAAARQRLSLRRHARGERLALLAADITLLVRQAYPTFPEEVRQRLALDRFVEALEPFELQTHVLLKDPASLDLAIEEAERAELVLSRGPTTRPTAAARPGRDTAGRRTMTCWRCGLPDHKVSECTLGSSLPSRRLGINGLYTPLMVNDKPVSALIDTGSAVSVLHYNTRAIRSNARILGGEKISLTTVTGERLVLGEHTLARVDFGRGPFVHKFWLGDTCDECILGLDFLRRAEAVINCETGGVSFSGGPSVVRLEGDSDRGDAGRGGHGRPDIAEAVRELWTRCVGNLTAEQKGKVWSLLEGYMDIFALSENDCTRTSLATHDIVTGDARPIRSRPHRLPFMRRKIAEEQINIMAEAGIIEPSNSPWVSPVVLSQKKDGNWRFCVDYRRLNAVTKLDAYPLPRIDESLELLAGSAWFSSLDLRSGYWQVPLTESAKERSAFTIGKELWQFNVLPFGLCNAPATFERLMEKVLRGVPNSKCLVYLDDVLVHACSFEAALMNLDTVLNRIRRANLKLNPAKCNLLQQRLNFLGHVVSSEGISTDPAKTEAVRGWPRPTNTKQVRSFLGLASYYRKFVQGFAEVAAPLHGLTGSRARFVWSPECENAFRELKDRLCSAPVLAYPKFDTEFILDTDASDHGVGGILSQVHEGTERVIGYFSRSLSKAERNYCVTRRELLAMIACLEHFRPYVYGVPFRLRTDHASLQWLLNLRDPEGQLARWLARLQEFKFDIVHRPGRIHGNADALSRRPCQSESCKHCVKVEVSDPDFVRCAALRPVDEMPQLELEAVPIEQFREAQLVDPEIGWGLRHLEASSSPVWDDVCPLGPVAKAIRSNWDNLRVKQGMLCREWVEPNSDKSILQNVVPVQLRERVLSSVHGALGSGHFGVSKTLRRLRQRFWWPGCRRDVELYVHCCDTCAAKKGPATRPRAPLIPMRSGSPMERVAVDVMGPFPVTEAGNKYVLVAMDYFTKWPEAYAVPDQSASTTATALVNEFFCRFGVPETLHSDQGRNFESEVMGEVCKLLGISKTRTTPLHPQGDGLVERFNRTLATQLAMVTSRHQRDWDVRLPAVLLACRSAVQESTGFTPACLMFGRELRTPIDLAFGAAPDAGPPYEPGPLFVKDLLNRLHDAHQVARDAQGAASLKQKRAYDARCSGGSLSLGQQVWLYNPKRSRGLCPKLQSSWVGPCSVIKQLSEVVYRVKWGRKNVVVHRDRLTPYRPKAPVGRRDADVDMSHSVQPAPRDMYRSDTEVPAACDVDVAGCGLWTNGR